MNFKIYWRRLSNEYEQKRGENNIYGHPRTTGDVDILMLVSFSPSQTKFKPSAGEF
jgi:hypothetical protein